MTSTSSNVTSLTSRRNPAPSKDRTLSLAVGKTVGNNWVQNKTVTWSTFMDKLTRPTITPETFAEYLAFEPSKQDATKDVGYFVFGHYTGTTRSKSNLPYVDAIVLDLDHCDPDWEFDMDIAFDGIKYALYSTHKHGPAAPRLRQVFPLTRRVTPEEYGAIARALAARYDIEVYDKTTFQYSRVMHWPSHAVDGDYICKETDGKWLDPQELLDEYQDWQDQRQWPTHASVTELHSPQKKISDPCEKAGWVGAFCRMYPISRVVDELIEGVYSWTTDTRMTFNGGTTSNGARVYEDKHVYSEHESDPCSGRLVNAFDLVRLHLYGHLDIDARTDTPISKLESYKAFVAEIESNPEFADVKIDMITDTAQRGAYEFDDETDGADDGSSKPPVGGTVRVPHAALTGMSSPPGWESKLAVDQNGNVMKTQTNLELILKFDPVWGFNIRRNDFAGSIVVTRSLPHHEVKSSYHKVNGDLFTERDLSQLKSYLEKRYSMRNMQAQTIQDALEVVGTEFSFHPVLNYFSCLPAWDGVPRVETLLHDYLGAADTPLNRAMVRKTLCGAVNRIHNPGSKWDHLLIIEGKQGLRKGMFLSTLAKNDSWFCEGLGADLGTTAVENMQSKWLIELPEGEGVLGTKRSTVDAVKGFITKRSDRMRLKYTRFAQDFSRQCIFIATTNRYEYLQDDTGNRRFWPVRCALKGRVDIDLLAKNVDQVWAEAMMMWKNKEQLWLDDPMEAALSDEHTAREVDDGMAGKIEAWLDEPIEHEFDSEDGGDTYREAVCITQIAVECLGYKENNLNRWQRDQITIALKQLQGWDWRPDKRVIVEGYGRQKVAVRIGAPIA